jgi:ribonucleoside-diphosphate reductase alpha chain
MSAVQVAVRERADRDIFVSKTPKFAPRVDTREELSKFIFKSKYARYNEQLGRREEWDEAVARVEAMHLRKFEHLSLEDRMQIRWAFDMVRAKKVVPSMRSMQFGGEAAEAHNARIYNCAVRHVDSIRAFAEVFYLLLCGCGVGLGLRKKFMARLPELVHTRERKGEPYKFFVPDTIEGWAESLEVLLKSYFAGNELSGREVVFDYSLIRPKGSPLRVGGGKAPGPLPLKRAHAEIKSILDHAILRGDLCIRSIDAYDILMHASDAVLSGGVRRSAACVVFDADDHDMMTAKTGDWHEHNKHRERSNNSIMLMRDHISSEDFHRVIEHTRQWGEPGFVFADHEDTLYNPCFEIGMIPVTDDGRCGVQFCNLTSINGSKINTAADFYGAAKAAAIIGTLQASYTDFRFLSPEAKEITESEALLGVSIIAMMENVEVLLNPIHQKWGAKIVKETNAVWAEKIGINPAARTTAIKPDGTCSLALGTMSSGIHPAHANNMFRRVQVNRNEPVYQFFRETNAHLCEPSSFKPETDDVVTFPVIVPDGALVKKDLDAIRHLEYIKSTQRNWVIPGTTEFNKKRVHHNVSCTVLVKEDEWEKVADYLYENRKYFSAVSLLPNDGDKRYHQAPMEAANSPADLHKFGKMLKMMQPVDYTLLRESTDSTELVQEVACVGGVCEI